MSYQQQFHRWLHSDALSPEGESPAAGHCRRPQKRWKTGSSACWSSAPPDCGG